MRRPLPVFVRVKEVTAQEIYKVKETTHVHCQKIWGSVFLIQRKVYKGSGAESFLTKGVRLAATWENARINCHNL
jgi:hypothetical protein